jgi:hypothetical protein
MKNLLKVSTYARMMDLSVQSVYNQIKDGKIPYTVIDGVTFVIYNKEV